MTSREFQPLRVGERRRGSVVWMAALIAAICFEGLGRKFVPQIPAPVFYFLKDVVLLVGLVAFGLRPSVVRTARHLYRGFGLVLALGVTWTFLQVLNPEQDSVALAVLGLRSYWLWWLAPLIIASALRDPDDVQRVVTLLAITAGVVAAYAAFQFMSPSDSAINRYALYRGEEMSDVTVVVATGRTRVSATFSYISGFADFIGFVPALLLSLGLGASSRLTRVMSLSAVAACAAVTPMSGSRGPVVGSLLALAVVAVTVGLHRSRMGRRVIGAGVIVVVAGIFAVPDAFAGLWSRFEGEDTRTRFEWGLHVLPPVALATYDYPALGIGTGMQQTARKVITTKLGWETESEPSRILVELGVPGYLFLWVARLGLVVALARAARRFRAVGQRGLVAAAAVYAAFTVVGANLVFDHISQALYFLGVGLILASAVPVVQGGGVGATAAAPARAGSGSPGSAPP
jgi:hypothetical protein